jgi:hypothetical protein
MKKNNNDSIFVVFLVISTDLWLWTFFKFINKIKYACNYNNELDKKKNKNKSYHQKF